jgi:hypothetical protein
VQVEIDAFRDRTGCLLESWHGWTPRSTARVTVPSAETWISRIAYPPSRPERGASGTRPSWSFGRDAIQAIAIQRRGMA